MTINRKIIGLHPAQQDDIGELQTRRPIPTPGLKNLGPFLFLNHHGPQMYARGNQGLPFGPHPHRGFETVRFILRGSLAHRDTAGHESIIENGGVQWMTAGSGLIHEETSPSQFKRDGGPLELLQLWVNLPARLKMTPPRYVGLQRDAIPAIPTPDGKAVVNLVSGSHAGQIGPIASLTNLTITTVEAKAGAKVAFGELGGRVPFLYVVAGLLQIEGHDASFFHLVELDEGGTLNINVLADSEFIFAHGEAIDEPLVMSGPFVMNSQAEIGQAFADYQAGHFGVPA